MARLTLRLRFSERLAPVALQEPQGQRDHKVIQALQARRVSKAIRVRKAFRVSRVRLARKDRLATQARPARKVTPVPLGRRAMLGHRGRKGIRGRRDLWEVLHCSPLSPKCFMLAASMTGL